MGAITDVAGIEVGVAGHPTVRTGCHVVVCRDGAVVGADVRGAAPGTRETDLCRPGTLVREAHAILLTGGSAFGLDAATGVMRRLHEQNIGFDAGSVRVPIVPGAVIFDIAPGAFSPPDAEMGYAACAAAGTGQTARGPVGAGSGATIGKALGPPFAMRSAAGESSMRCGDYWIAALVVVNAIGDIVDPETGATIAGARDPVSGEFLDSVRVLTGQASPPSPPGTNTTIGVVATDAPLDKEQVWHLARVSHDGLARAIRPVHTMYDGDTMFALATGKAAVSSPPNIMALAAAAALVTERAIVDAARFAAPLDPGM